MNGRVFRHHLLVDVPFRLSSQQDISIEFVIDTGFVGFLTLPLSAVQTLGQPRVRSIPATLADNSKIRVGVYLANIIWHNQERQVEVLAMGNRPLLGMVLLDGGTMDVEFTDGGLLQLGTI